MSLRRFSPLGFSPSAWAALASFGAYVLLAAPGLYWLDSGELAAAAHLLGVAHPTGFPLCTLLGKLFALLPVGGEIAFRITLFSAACAALAVYVVGRVVAQTCSGDGWLPEVAAAVAAAMLAVGMTFLRQATVAEVYAPTALCLVLALFLGQQVAAGAGARPGLGLALLMGLGLGAHVSFRLLALPPALLLFAIRLRRGERWPLLAPLFIVLGAGVNLQLVLAAGREPLSNWGSLGTLGSLFSHLGGERIRRAFAEQMLSGNLPTLVSQVHDYAALWLDQLGVLALVLSAAGAISLVGRRPASAERASAMATGAASGTARQAGSTGHWTGGRWTGLLLLVIGGADFVYAVWVNPMGIADLQNGTPLSVILALLAGVGVAAVARPFGRAAPAVALVLGVMAVVPAALDRAGDKLGGTSSAPLEYARAALAQTDPRGLVLTESDDLSAGLGYLQAAGGERPDVAVVVRQHAWDAAYLRRVLSRRGFAHLSEEQLRQYAVLPESERIAKSGTFLVQLVRHNLGRLPVLWEPGSNLDPLPQCRPVAGVPLYHLSPPAAVSPTPPSAPGTPASGPPAPAGAAPPSTHSPAVSLAGPPAGHDPVAEVARLLGGTADDPPGRRLAASALGSLARDALATGDLDRAADLFARAAAVSPAHAVAARLNLSVVAARRGDPAVALRLAREVLARRPAHALALCHAGRYSLAVGDDHAAEGYYRRALDVASAAAPGTAGGAAARRAEALAGLGIIAARRGEHRQAADLLRQALDLDPANRDAAANLPKVLLRVRRDSAGSAPPGR